MRRLVVAAALAAVIVIVVPHDAFIAPARAMSACGVERWPVKTLTDPAAKTVTLRPRAATVRALAALPVPHVGRDTPRLQRERVTYRVRARLVEMKLEDDSDIHLVIADTAHPSRTMIVEFPASACTHGAARAVRLKMSTARRAIIVACGPPSASRFETLSGTAVISGVAFFDVIHGQTGVAPNGIELHPALSFSAQVC